MAYCVPLGIPHSAFLGWAEDDQDKALAWQREQAQVCKGCGTRDEEWQRNRLAYVGQQRTCLGCMALEQEAENIREAGRGGYTYPYLAPFDQAKPPEEED